MAYTSYRQKRVKVGIPVSQHRVWVQNLKKGDRMMMPPGCTVTEEPELLPDDLFQRYEVMPVNFKKLPFAFSMSHPMQEDIQKILHYSLKQQREEDVSYCSGFVSALIKSCLNAIDVPCTLEMGYRKADKEDFPHVWLKFDGDIVVDNSYEKYMTKSTITYLEKNTPKCYKQSIFSFSAKNYDSKNKDDFAYDCYRKFLEIFLEKPDTGFAVNLNHEQLYAYYFSMIRFMWETFGVNVSGIQPAVRHYCWGCGVFPAHSSQLLTDILPEGYQEVKEDLDKQAQLKFKFKQCSQCMVASYCSSKCQEDDWEEQHRFLCVSRATGPASDY